MEETRHLEGPCEFEALWREALELHPVKIQRKGVPRVVERPKKAHDVGQVEAQDLGRGGPYVAVAREGERVQAAVLALRGIHPQTSTNHPHRFGMHLASESLTSPSRSMPPTCLRHLPPLTLSGGSIGMEDPGGLVT